MPPFDPELLDALEASTVDRIEGTAWRQVLAPTSVTRANLRGGRWNPLGVETLYCSLAPATTAAEIDALLAAQPVPIRRQRLTYSIHVELSKVADLRVDPWAATFDYEHDLGNLASCQLIGAAAGWLKLGGLVVPSVRTMGDNLVVFVANQGPDDCLEPAEAFEYPPGPPVDHQWTRLRPQAAQQSWEDEGDR